MKVTSPRHNLKVAAQIATLSWEFTDLRSAPRLALRLWAAPHAAHALGKVALFEHATLVLIIDAEGIAAVACEGPREPDACLVPGAEWPQLQLVR